MQSNICLQSREAALNYPAGDIHLAYCWKCGQITNVAYDYTLIEKTDQNPGSVDLGNIYSDFNHRLAEYLIKEYDLHGKEIVEIGGTKGEFLSILCEMGENNGIGIGRGLIGVNPPTINRGSIKYLGVDFSEYFKELDADFIICRMTLENTQSTREFISTIRRAVGDRAEVTVIFQISEVFRILRELAFWDINYQRCSYFSAGSLARLFRKCGFDVIDLWKDFSNQSLMIEAKPGISGPLIPPLPQENDLNDLFPLAGYFTQAVKNKARNWINRLKDYEQRGIRCVLWGANSKAVAFLTSLKIRQEILFVTDDRSDLAGTYIPQTGQEIIEPNELRNCHPDVVIFSDVLFLADASKKLSEMGLMPQMVSINA